MLGQRRACGPWPGRVVVEEIAVVYGDDFARTSDGEVDAGFAVGDACVVLVYECSGDVGNVIPVGSQEVSD